VSELYQVDVTDIISEDGACALVDRLNEAEQGVPRGMRRRWWWLSGAYRIVTNASTTDDASVVTYSGTTSNSPTQQSQEKG
jgi:hypothetical protein